MNDLTPPVESGSELETVLQETFGKAYLGLDAKERLLFLEAFSHCIMSGEAFDVKAVCQKAGVPRASMEKLMGRGIWELFLRWLGRRAVSSILSRIPAIADKIGEQAMAGSAAQQKMVLQMTGLIEPENSGALPNPAATLVLQAAWTGGFPAFFLDNNSA